jgi:predicted lipid-binding transport protein (Tim44 family)
MIGLLVVAVMFIFRMLKGKSGNQAAPAYAGGSGNSAGFSIPEIGSRIEPSSSQPVAFHGLSSAGDAGSNPAPWGVPADFDTAGFLRHAKTNFIRMQAAWDKADVNDIREFTTPELYAELKMQLTERGASPNNTDVVAIDAQLLGIETVGNEYLASVRFTGTIREAINAPAEPFAEVWNLAKPVNGQSGWLLAGIQQVQ